ncbi:uncharacterized protein BX663DRAFT_527501 [Cokeromyces recurvatus]|uniref:uncharacterized protein n=1 Tax=Cokeromyces recurvatus TaxID=90255 RepID=UPI00221E76EF|nr:uncharacterized protein BX663DRAFT_527501 [Cokeromyces recurvatus]KAI7897663.1 hypothetical protein BX663DRAFT_527501 [Cokeromyces recurvatus]
MFKHTTQANPTLINCQTKQKEIAHQQMQKTHCHDTNKRHQKHEQIEITKQDKENNERLLTEKNALKYR